MAVALARHDELVEQVVTSRGGRLIKTRGEGDATFSVFERPSAAAAAAIELQDAISREPWALAEPMRIRYVAAARGGMPVDQLADDLDARGAHPLGGSWGEGPGDQAAQPVVLGAVEADDRLAELVPQRAGAYTLRDQADAARHREAGIAQHGAHQVVGEQLGPVGT
jgi:hypothetical protein